jgi:polyhydroxybutyrate depolymerase
VVLDIHGLAEGAEIHTQMSAMAALAEQEGFVVVTPQGMGTVPYWNFLQHAEGPRDVEFLGAVLDDVQSTVCTDMRRVFVTGLSNGAFMTSTLACELTDRIGAIAPVAGVRFETTCEPTRPVPVLAFHGTDDQIVAYDPAVPVATGDDASEVDEEGSDIPFDAESAANFSGYTPVAAPESMLRWAEVGGCATAPSESSVSPEVTLLEWDGCDDGVEVSLYRVEGGGHTWPGSQFSAAIASIVGFTTMELDASRTMWEFFERHPLPTS